jgi:hypothetical protein
MAPTFEAEARIALFGFEPTPAVVVLQPRAKTWRVGGAARIQALGLVLAPLVGLVPPHAPWALGALVGGFYLARRRWRHHFTLEEVRGNCPRCGEPVSPPLGMLQTPHPVPCPSCRFDGALEVDAETLRRHLEA